MQSIRLPIRCLSGRGFIAWLGALAALIPLGTCLRAEPTSRPINILVITADDLGPQLGCYGDSTAPTPHLDALAAEGCRFLNGYVTQPSCSPSRSSILTGLYPHQNGQTGLANAGFPYTMRPDVETLPRILWDAGYRTGIIGKLHVNPDGAFPFSYARKEAPPTRHVRQVAEQAAEFLAKDPDKPFFLYVNYFDPHVKFVDQVDGLPLRPIKPDQVRPWPWQQIDTSEQRQRIAGYYNGVARMDAGVKLLLDTLAAAGHRDDTLIIFLGDNGPPFARAKTTCYEAGVRVPIIVRWPGAKRGITRDELVSTVDIMPTVLDAAGISPRPELPGQSWQPLLQAKSVAWRQTLTTEHTSHKPTDYFPRRSIRDARYKLIVNLAADRGNPILSTDADTAYEISRDPSYAGSVTRRAFDTLAQPPPEELYDLQVDPNELVNLAGRPEYLKIQDRLRAQLLEWRTRTADPLLDPATLEALGELHDEYARDGR